jgi:hypothetical protein
VASWTYGAVIFVTILSVVAYRYMAPKRTGAAPAEENRLVTVGSVWIPIYPGSTLEGTASAKRESATESTLNFGTKDQADRVLSFYEAALKQGVFRFETVKIIEGGGTVQSIVHQGKTTVLVTIQAAGDGSKGEIRTTDRNTGDKDTRN